MDARHPWRPRPRPLHLSINDVLFIDKWRLLMESTALLPKLFGWAFTILETLLGLGALIIFITILIHPSLPPTAHFGPIQREVGGQTATFSLAPPPSGGAPVVTV